MIIILVDIIMMLEPLIQLGFYAHLKTLDTILQLSLIEFMVLNG